MRNKIKKLNKFVSKNEPIIQIIIFSVGSFLLLYFLFKYLTVSFKLFFDYLAVKIYFDKTLFLGLTIFLIFILILRYVWLEKLKTQNRIISNFKKLLNVYFLLALYLSTLLVFHGYYFLTINFAKKIPIENIELTQWPNTFDIVNPSLKKEPSISCYSLTGKNDFVFDDRIKCNVNISHKNNSLYPYTVMFAKIDLLNGSEPIIKHSTDKAYTFKEGTIPLELRLNDYNYYRLHIAIGLKNNTDESDTGVFSIDIPLEVINREEYTTKNIQKFSLIATLLVIVGFATFGLVKNIKDLIED